MSNFQYNPDGFENELCVSYICKLQFYLPGAAQRLEDIRQWLKTNVGNENFNFGFEDYGQHGEYMLYTRTSEDLLAFKLRFIGVT